MGVNKQLTIGEPGSRTWDEVIDIYADFNNRMVVPR
jgi:hypothetical protein